MKKYTGTEHTRLPPQFCPFCFTLLDAATNMTSLDAPQPGDFTICVNCSGILRYEEGMTVVASSLLEIPTHSRMEFAKVARLNKEFRSQRPPAKPSSKA